MKFTDITLSDASIEAKVETLGIVLDKKLSEMDTQVSTVSKIVGPMGPKGDKGEKGAQGLKGNDGKDGKNGKDGKDGKDGVDGDDGNDGISIVNASVAIDGSLVLELSNGNQIDAGEVVGPAGPGGLNGMTGPQGPAGVGVPTGGTTGQVLSKIDSTDYNTQWVTPSGGSGAVTSVNTKTGAVVLTASDVGAEPADATILKSANIGVSVQAYDSDLTAWAGVSTTAKQDTLVSGTNIKTVNSNSLLGSGNISVGTVTSVTGTAPIASSGGNTPAISISQATTTTDGYLSSTDWNTFNNKQAALVSGTNIKTINGSSVVGSGNLVVTALLAEATSVFSTGSAQTYTAPANTQWVKVTVVGPGGNGGGANNQRATGGGGGAVAIKWLQMNAGQTLIYTVGTASGTASTVSSGTLTITTISAGSGANGAGTAYANSITAGPAGGTASGGDININGGQGGHSVGSSTTVGTNFSGKGGDCPGFGTGGNALAIVATAGVQGVGFGAGGGGAHGSNTTAAGRGGVVIFEAY